MNGPLGARTTQAMSDDLFTGALNSAAAVHVSLFSKLVILQAMLIVVEIGAGCGSFFRMRRQCLAGSDHKGCISRLVSVMVDRSIHKERSIRW